MSHRWVLTGLALGLLATAPAHAACSGASIEEEYRQADIVIRARLVSEQSAWHDEPSTEYRRQWGEAPAVRYELRSSDIFKGRSGTPIIFFQERNSGAFYLDIDRDYLLFLNRIPAYPGRPAVATDAYYVRHACGQSKPWNDVRPADLALLRTISGQSD